MQHANAQQQNIGGNRRENAGANETPTAFTWDIPVRITICRANDGTGWDPATIDEASMEGFLANMNSKLVGGPNIFHFFRCGPINYIDSDQLLYGSVPVSSYSYNRNFLNLYLYYKPSQNPSASFPWYPEPKAVYLTSGTTDIANGSGFHELGHTLGLLHTFSPEETYRVPVTPDQVDNPDKPGGREIVITAIDLTKQFQPNGANAGDRVTDTPAGCNSVAVQFPSSATIAGCLDNDPATPCVNGCLDGNSNTPCETGCTWDFTNCTYTGNYRDYNFDPLQDPNNILAKNLMSYTGACRSNFTPGQIIRADNVTSFYLNDYYKGELCGNLMDRVEIEGSSVGLNRVSMRINQVLDATDYTLAVVNANGEFNGKLRDNVNPVQVTAELKRFKANDITVLDDDWLSGLTTYDVLYHAG